MGRSSHLRARTRRVYGVAAVLVGEGIMPIPKCTEREAHGNEKRKKSAKPVYVRIGLRQIGE